MLAIDVGTYSPLPVKAGISALLRCLCMAWHKHGKRNWQQSVSVDDIGSQDLVPC